MGEIKSTLDLVMERTRHLSLSAEEKASQQQAEYQKRLQGLLQHYADEAFTIAVFRERFGALQEETQMTGRQVLAVALVERIDPDQDNVRWLDLLAQEAPVLCDPLQAILYGYRSQQADLLTASGQDQLDRLARQHDISGTAVMPNPLQDAACRQSLSTLRQAVKARIEELVEKHSASI